MNLPCISDRYGLKKWMTDSKVKALPKRCTPFQACRHVLQSIFQIFSDFIKIIPSPDHQNRGGGYLYAFITPYTPFWALFDFFIYSKKPLSLTLPPVFWPRNFGQRFPLEKRLFRVLLSLFTLVSHYYFITWVTS